MTHTSPNHQRGRSGRIQAIASILVVLLSVGIPATALAQDSSDGPASETTASIDFPIMLGGRLLEAETYSGPEWLARFSEGENEDPTFVEGTEALLEGVGKGIDDLTVTTALYEPLPGQRAVVAALRIDDTDARTFAEDAIRLMLGDVAMPELVLRRFGAKWTLRIEEAGQPGVYPRTVYLLDDTAWIIEGDESVVWDALDQLDDPAPTGALERDTLSSDMPLILDDRRRAGLWEETPPWFMPMLQVRLGDEVDDWLVDLYLDTGALPSQLLGVTAWWGAESELDSIMIEGYRLPAVASEFSERLRSDIFLGEGLDAATFAGLLEGVGVNEQQMGGRDVTTLDYGVAKQHVIAGEDTVWVVTDHVGEPEMAEEAIAALP